MYNCVSIVSSIDFSMNKLCSHFKEMLLFPFYFSGIFYLPRGANYCKTKFLKERSQQLVP